MIVIEDVGGRGLMYSISYCMIIKKVKQTKRVKDEKDKMFLHLQQ